MIALLAALFLSSNAGGKTLVRQQQGTTVPASNSDVLAYFPFLVPGCYPSGGVMGTKGQTITVSRAGTRTCNVAAAGAAPQLVTCQANEACVDGVIGLEPEPGRTNLILRSGSLASSPWSKNNSAGTTLPVITASAELGPDGVSTVDQISFPAVAAAQYSQVFQPFTGTAAAYSGGLWLKKVSGTGNVLPVRFHCAAAIGRVACPVSTAWSRCVISGTLAASTCNLILGEDHGSTGQTMSDIVVLATDAQAELGAYATSYIPTAGTSVARNADAVTITNPLAATNPSSWCVEGTYTPESGRAWTQTPVTGLVSAGTAGAANTWFGNQQAGNAYFATYDAAGAQRYVSVSTGSGFSGAHRIGLSYAAGTLSFLRDGTSVGGSQTGAGTGVVATQPATMLLGSRSDASSEFGGGIRDLKVRKGACR